VWRHARLESTTQRKMTCNYMETLNYLDSHLQTFLQLCLPLTFIKNRWNDFLHIAL
jgi:hypothetical protein